MKDIDYFRGGFIPYPEFNAFIATVDGVERQVYEPKGQTKTYLDWRNSGGKVMKTA